MPREDSIKDMREMPTFKTLKEAERYGEKNYFRQEYKETIHGSWEVREGYGKKKE